VHVQRHRTGRRAERRGARARRAEPGRQPDQRAVSEQHQLQRRQNWEADSGDVWTVPLGLQIGQILKTMRLQFTLMFPK
jgi:hypothetical protein